jgi:hypothetical protein
MLAYASHSEPPAFPLEANIFVELAAGFTYGQRNTGELADLWPKAVRHFGFYDYYSAYQEDRDSIPAGRGASVDYVTSHIRCYYSKHAGIALTAESGANWGASGRGYYIASRLMWDPDADAGTLVADFYEKALVEPLSTQELPLEPDLADIFKTSRRRKKGVRPAADLLRENRETIIDKVTYWTGVQRPLVKALVEAIVSKVAELNLNAEIKCEKEHLTEVTVYATALAMNYLTRGKFSTE